VKTEFEDALAQFTAAAKPITTEEQRLIDATMADLERMFAEKKVKIRAVPIIDKINLSPFVPTREITRAQLSEMFDYRVPIKTGEQVAAGLRIAAADDDKPLK